MPNPHFPGAIATYYQEGLKRIEHKVLDVSKYKEAQYQDIDLNYSCWLILVSNDNHYLGPELINLEAPEIVFVRSITITRYAILNKGNIIYLPDNLESNILEQDSIRPKFKSPC